MPIAVTEDHESLRLTVRRWAQTHCPPGVPRAVAEAAAPDLPAVWEKLGAQGWLGLHLPERHGGQGFTVAELAVVLEELGHALVPGPLLPTVLVSGVIAAHAGEALRAELLPGLADGTITAAVAPGWRRRARGEGRRHGRAAHRHGPPAARAADGAARAGARGGRGGRVAVVPASTASSPAPPARSSRCRPSTARAPSGAWTWAAGITVDAARRSSRCPTTTVRGLLLALAAAESAGIARWCLETASEYAKVRVQFGRPIGQFQAVKHALADMLVAVEQCAAVAWDAAAAWSEERAGRARAGPQRAHRRRDRACRRPRTAPSSASRSSAASGSPGSTTRTST